MQDIINIINFVEAMGAILLIAGIIGISFLIGYENSRRLPVPKYQIIAFIIITLLGLLFIIIGITIMMKVNNLL